MDSQYVDRQLIAIQEADLDTPSSFVHIDSFVTQDHCPTSDFTEFHGHFQGTMDMYAAPEQVSAYLDTHQNWFRNCANPMKAEPIGANGYAITIGRFGSFGYEVEPKIGLELLPQADGIYRIVTIPVPDYMPPGYNVDFQASQWLVAVPSSECLRPGETDSIQLPPIITRVEWILDLKVAIKFPKFIQKLPQSLIQTTGDRILNQIVRQISRHLTAKVQSDFHNTNGLPIPQRLNHR